MLRLFCIGTWTLLNGYFFLWYRLFKRNLGLLGLVYYVHFRPFLIFIFRFLDSLLPFVGHWVGVLCLGVLLLPFSFCRSCETDIVNIYLGRLAIQLSFVHVFFLFLS